MNVLAIGAHPDDIEIGCGGVLSLMKEQGHSLFLFVATDGSMGGEIQQRKQEASQSAEILGARLEWGNFTDTMIIYCSSTVIWLESMLRDMMLHDHEPDIVFVHHPEDTHQDHRNLSMATITACRNEHCLLFYEGITTVGFSPVVSFDITEHIKKKEALLRSHESQMRKVIRNTHETTLLDFSHAMASLRGVHARVKYAESFVPHRMVMNVFLQ